MKKSESRDAERVHSVFLKNVHRHRVRCMHATTANQRHAALLWQTIGQSHPSTQRARPSATATIPSPTPPRSCVAAPRRRPSEGVRAVEPPRRRRLSPRSDRGECTTTSRSACVRVVAGGSARPPTVPVPPSTVCNLSPTVFPPPTPPCTPPSVAVFPLSPRPDPPIGGSPYNVVSRFLPPTPPLLPPPHALPHLLQLAKAAAVQPPRGCVRDVRRRRPRPPPIWFFLSHCPRLCAPWSPRSDLEMRRSPPAAPRPPPPSVVVAATATRLAGRMPTGRVAWTRPRRWRCLGMAAAATRRSRRCCWWWRCLGASLRAGLTTAPVEAVSNRGGGEVGGGGSVSGARPGNRSGR